ncbi:MAG: phage tail tape measure protein [Magnetococcales bacterium]|nr:phage tail tape measure protein [Magnetococcales bacterium]
MSSALHNLTVTLTADPAAFVRGIRTAQTDFVSGMRAIRNAAGKELAGIGSTLNTIKLFEGTTKHVDALKTALGPARTEAERLSNAFQKAKGDLDRTTQQIDKTKAALERLKQTPVELRTNAQKAEIESLQGTIRKLAEQAGALRGFSSTLRRDTDLTNRTVTGLNAALVTQSRELERLGAALRVEAVDTSRLAAAQKVLEAQMARVAERARSRQRITDAKDVLGMGPSTNAEREIVRLEAAYRRLSATGNLSARELASAHTRMVQGIVEVRNNANGLGSSFFLVREQLVKLVVASAGVGLAAKEAIAFESAMTDVRKVVDFDTPQAFGEMTSEIKAMSREIPITLVGLAKIAEAGGQMGIAAKDIQGFTDVAAKMSTAFKISHDEAGVAIGRLMNVFALTVPQTRLLADAINHLGNNTNAVERDIVEVMNRVGGMARVFGLANTETAALSATFLSMGLGPERSATAINALTRELMNAPQQTDKFKNALQRIGLTSVELTTMIRQGPQQAILDLLRTLSGLDKQSKMETLVGLFGDLYSDEIVQVVNNLEKYKEILGLVAKESNYVGSTQKEFAERIKTTEAQLQLAKNAISEVGINLGTAFLPGITIAANGVAALSNGLALLTREFPGLSAGIVTTVTAMAGFGALRLAWSLVRAEVIALLLPLRAATAAAMAFAMTPTGMVLTATVAALYAFTKATASSVPGLVEHAAAMAKSRTEAQEKIKSLEVLRTTLESTKPGTKEHTDAEEKLAAILPEANLALDEQGRVLARVGDAANDNAKKLNEYIGILKKEDTQHFALQLDLQARAFDEARKEMATYVQDLKSEYGIGTGEALSMTQRFWLGLDKLTGSYDGHIARGAELRRHLNETQGGMKALITEAVKAGLSVEDLGRAMDGVRADPAVIKQVVTLYRAITQEAETAANKTATVTEALKTFAMAISGPANAAKKAVLDAIGVTDKQLGKQDEALNKHRQTLQKQVDDEQKSWHAIGELVATASQSVTEQIAREYAKRRDLLEMSADAGLEAEKRYAGQLPGMVAQALDQRATAEQQADIGSRALSDRKLLSEKQKMEAHTALYIAESRARSVTDQKYLTAALLLIDREYQARIRNAKRLGQDAARVDEERLQAQKAVLGKIETAYRSNIDQLIAEERRHLEAVRQIEEQRAALKTSVADRLARLAEKTMNPEQVYASRQERYAREQTQAEEALRAGNYESARRHAERMMDLAEQTSDAVMRGDRVIVSAHQSAAQAARQLQYGAAIADKAMQKQGETHQQEAEKTKKQYEALTKQLTGVQKILAGIAQVMIKNHEMILTADASKVWQAITEIDTLIEKRERVINIRTELQDSASTLDKASSQISTGNLEQVKQSVASAAQVFDHFKKEVEGYNPEIKANFDIKEGEASIKQVSDKLKEYQESVKKNAQTELTVDTSRAIPAIHEVKNAVDALQDKTITLTTINKTVEAHAAGGLIGLMRGGMLPGYGGGDRRPALLEDGEWVINKRAVRQYGSPLFAALNAMRLDPASVPRFSRGGMVNGVQIPSWQDLPRIPTFATGGMVTPPVEGVMRLDLTRGDRSASVHASRDELLGLVALLKEAERGML